VGAIAVDASGLAAFTGPIAGPMDFGVGPLIRKGGSYLAALDPAGRVRWAQRPLDWSPVAPVFDGAGNLFAVGRGNASSTLVVAAFARSGAPGFSGSFGKGVRGDVAAAADRRTGALVVAGSTLDGPLDLGTGPLSGEGTDVFVAALAP
jgi:hypothetical protein